MVNAAVRVGRRNRRVGSNAKKEEGGFEVEYLIMII